MVDVPRPDDAVKLVSQVTISENVERWGLEVYAANQVRAQRRARVWVRKEVPTARNFFDPDAETEQASFVDLFTDSFNLEWYDVSIKVVR